ncbi:MAG: ATP-binding cassette domain-containing protein, partial [Mesorhizobium sp.]
MSTLEIDRARKLYGDLEVLKEVSISIATGDFLVLLGPSGCGKSTLLNMIAGLENISGGEIRIAGRVVNDLSPKDRDIAMVFQSYALYPTMTVRQNIEFGMKIRGVPQAERDKAVKTAADLLQMTHLLDRKPSQLSGGQRQRVAMGRAIVRQPKLFLFDEPLSNLDAKLRVDMRTEIKRLHARLGTTIVYVTHDQIEAMTLATRVAVMKDGVVQHLDDPQSVYDRPANVYVAKFVGSPSMNIVPARLDVEDGRPVAVIDVPGGAA